MGIRKIRKKCSKNETNLQADPQGEASGIAENFHGPNLTIKKRTLKPIGSPWDDSTYIYIHEMVDMYGECR